MTHKLTDANHTNTYTERLHIFDVNSFNHNFMHWRVYVFERTFFFVRLF